MMKRLYLFFMLLVATATSIAMAQTKVQIGDIYYELSGDQASVTHSTYPYGFWPDTSPYQNDKYVIPSSV